MVYMMSCRLSSCKTGVYNVRLLIILEREGVAVCIDKKGDSLCWAHRSVCWFWCAAAQTEASDEAARNAARNEQPGMKPGMQPGMSSQECSMTVKVSCKEKQEDAISGFKC